MTRAVTEVCILLGFVIGADFGVVTSGPKVGAAVTDYRGIQLTEWLKFLIQVCLNIQATRSSQLNIAFP